MKRTAKRTFGQEIIARLEHLADALERGAEIEDAFRCRRVEAEIKPEQDVKQTRQMLGASQANFGRLLGVTAQTVREWEQGANEPSDIAKRFMDEIRLNPDYWRGRLAQVVVVKKRRAKSGPK